MRKTKNGFGILLMMTVGGIFFLSCEKTINPELPGAAPVLVVDGWLNNKPEKQFITLSLTQPYFDFSQPVGVSGATVSVQDETDGVTVYHFIENPSVKGSYEWMPSLYNLGTIGHHYKLTIILNGETFVASSRMGRVPLVDSITFSKQNSSRKNITRYYGEFWATDPKGPGDTYWIKTTKNDTLLTLPAEINTAYDAGLSAGGDADGVIFIQPIRRKITPTLSTNQSATDSPLNIGDSVYVEIHSISLAAFNFLGQVVTQTNRPGGFGQLFATPLANVSSNIANVNPTGSAVVGFFNTAAVSGRGQRFTRVKP